MRKVQLFEGFVNEDTRLKSLGKSTSKFFKALAKESKETKDAFSKIYRSVRHGEEITDEERTEIGNQLKDVLKTIGLSTIAVMPGGLIVGLLLKALKIQKMVIPSNFMYLVDEKED